MFLYHHSMNYWLQQLYAPDPFWFVVSSSVFRCVPLFFPTAEACAGWRARGSPQQSVSQLCWIETRQKSRTSHTNRYNDEGIIRLRQLVVFLTLSYYFVSIWWFCSRIAVWWRWTASVWRNRCRCAVFSCCVACRPSNRQQSRGGYTVARLSLQWLLLHSIIVLIINLHYEATASQATTTTTLLLSAEQLLPAASNTRRQQLLQFVSIKLLLPTAKY